MVNRNLEYEINPLIDSTQNWLATGMASTSDEGAGIGDDGQADWQQGNEWKTTHLADGYEQYWEFYDGSHGPDSPTPGDATADADGNPTNAPLVDLMNTRGVSIYNYTGHGWEQGLVSGNFNTDAVGNLRNTGRYPILIAVACCAGNFTNGECLGETWQRAGDASTGEPWGGIAGFFSSDYQSWSPPMEGQDGMNQYLADADGVNLRPSMAGMLAYGNARMIAAYGPGGEIMADFWNPFAEPSTMPRTRRPQALSASHPDSINFESLSLAVACPVEGAQVSLYWEKQTWAVATVENGIAVLEFAPFNNIGELIVTVTQFNHTPYQGSIVVKPATKPFVVSQQAQIDDSGGNNNQKADFGESVTWNVLLRNIGQGTANAVSATLSTSNPAVTITNGQATPGNLNSNGAVLAAFAFVVRDDIPNGVSVEFTLTLQYNDTITYATTLPLTLFAPALEIGSWTIDDSINGNGNKRLESGETATLRIINRNTGGSNSPDALGTLTALTPYLTVSDPVSLGNLDAATGEKAAFFYLSVSPNAPSSLTVNLSYNLSAGQYTAVETLGPLMLNAIVETFETNNFSAFNWEAAGDKSWQITTANPYVGQYCARSGTITHNQSSSMQLSLLTMQDGLVSFARRVSSEADYDFLRFYIDGVELGAWSGNLPWGEAYYPVSAGQHQFTWSYEKDDLVSNGTDRAWVDEITLPPHQIVVNAVAPPMDWQPAVQAMPNPSTGLVTVRVVLPEEQMLEIQVFDCLGRRVQSYQPARRTPAGVFTHTLDLSANAPGIYLICVQAERRRQQVKVVVQGAGE
ncbi:MAG: T9SS type A sorting domain-containing protein [Saprospirales bacterium]|nr:T9SS type A sorting domain-containing protein [Saprospirales bacterium]